MNTPTVRLRLPLTEDARRAVWASAFGAAFVALTGVPARDRGKRAMEIADQAVDAFEKEWTR